MFYLKKKFLQLLNRAGLLRPLKRVDRNSVIELVVPFIIHRDSLYDPATKRDFLRRIALEKIKIVLEDRTDLVRIRWKDEGQIKKHTLASILEMEAVLYLVPVKKMKDIEEADPEKLFK